MNARAGKYVNQSKEYKAFIPNPLPPKPPIRYDDELREFLYEADRTLARLDGVTTVLPNPELFIAMYVKKEALLSSQIEGTQASLEDVLEFEANLVPKDNPDDVKEVVNYIKALNYGIERLKELPMSLRLIREIHKILLEDTRGGSRTPGNFRKTQNWIGPAGTSLSEATYVPPPPNLLMNLMGDLESFIHKKDNIHPLIKIALIHSQFETIHPFLDGNGRIGRLLITFYLYWMGLLTKPLLYISFYLKKNRNKYYDLLMKVRNDGLWKDWLKFFLKGVSEVSAESAKTAGEIIELKERFIKKLYDNSVSSVFAVKLLDLLLNSPIIETKDVTLNLGVHKDTANELVKTFKEIGILKEITGKKRYKKYLFKDYVEIIKRGTEI